jgi:hypothetical protein
MWSDYAEKMCKSPTYGSVRDERIFMQMSNPGLEILTIKDLVGAGKWANRQEKEDAKKSAPRYVNFGSYCAEEYADDLPVSIWMREAKDCNGSSVNNMGVQLKKWIERAALADERQGMTAVFGGGSTLVTVDNKPLFDATHTTFNGDVYSNIVNVNNVVLGAPTPTEIEKAVENVVTLALTQKDEDGEPMSQCFDKMIMLASPDLFVTLTKALTNRNGFCCTPDNIQFAGTAGMTILQNPYLDPKTAIFINSNKAIFRDQVLPLTTDFVEAKYQANYESVYRGRYRTRYGAYKAQGIWKLNFA